MTDTTIDAAAWATWRTEREELLATPHGWLSLTGYHWIPENGAVPGLPGHLTIAEGGGPVTYHSDPAAPVTDLSTGSAVVDRAQADVPELGSLLWLEYGTVRWELIRRLGRLAFRTRDSQAPTLTGFTGVPTFDFDPAWVCRGSYTAYDTPRTLTVDTAMPGLTEPVTAIGSVDVELPGLDQPCELVVYPSGDADDGSTGFRLLFHDAGNGTLTALWRSMTLPAPDENGVVVVDFNRAVNLPFAFSDYGTCDRPPAGNVIDVVIRAGERVPDGRSATAGADDPTAG